MRDKFSIGQVVWVREGDLVVETAITAVVWKMPDSDEFVGYRYSGMPDERSHAPPSDVFSCYAALFESLHLEDCDPC